MENPMFGEKDESANYQDRYAAYIIVETHGKIAMIEAPNGAFFCQAVKKRDRKQMKKRFLVNYWRKWGSAQRFLFI